MGLIKQLILLLSLLYVNITTHNNYPLVHIIYILFQFSASDLLSSVVFCQYSRINGSFRAFYSLWNYHRHWGITMTSESITEKTNNLYFLKTPLVTNSSTHTHPLHTKLSRLHHMGFAWKEVQWQCSMRLSGLGNVSQAFCCLHSIANKICSRRI